MPPIRVKNYKLPVIRPGWQGNLFDEGGRFMNEEHSAAPTFIDVLKWSFQRNPQRHEKRRDPYRLHVVDSTDFVKQRTDCIVWLGHSSFYIRIGEVVILIDPVFYDIPFVRRYSRHAFSPAALGPVHYLLISHDHRDHCQKRSIMEVVESNPGIEVLTGLQMDQLLRPWISKSNIQCAGWYQQFRTRPSLAVSFLPTQHWAKRGPNDTNTRLWGAFVIQSATHTIYFGGDSGYGSHFRDAAVLFPTIDIALVGVGAYKPSWIMKANHLSPQEAVQATNDLKARVMIPMHYGTFDLSEEPPGEPASMLQSLKAAGELKADLKMLQPGEVFELVTDDHETSVLS